MVSAIISWYLKVVAFVVHCSFPSLLTPASFKPPPPPPICSPASVEQNSTSSGKPWWATATSTETGRFRKTSWLSAWASNSAEMTSLHPAQSCFPPSVWPPYVSIPGDDALWFTPPSSSLHRELEFSLHVLSKESQNPPLDICVWFAS